MVYISITFTKASESCSSICFEVGVEFAQVGVTAARHVVAFVIPKVWTCVGLGRGTRLVVVVFSVDIAWKETSCNVPM
jgi:hypothetical protein